MKGKSSSIVALTVLVLLLGIGFIIWQKSQVQVPAKPTTTAKREIKKIDLTTQPDWIQKLSVTVVPGRSANGLNNFTFKIANLPAAKVLTLSYVAQYDTTKYGSQGSLSFTPIDVSGKSEYSKTIDLGTCSTKSCVRHDGVTAVDLELTFTTNSDQDGLWTGNLPLK